MHYFFFNSVKVNKVYPDASEKVDGILEPIKLNKTPLIKPLDAKELLVV